MPIGSLIGGMIGKSGADAAASGINSAASNANFQMQQAAKENRSNLSPWTSTGTSAIGQIGSLLGYGALWNRGGDGATYNYEADPNAQANAQNALRGYIEGSGVALPSFDELKVPWNFEADPGYQFRLSEGNKALDRSAASRGMLLSGAQAKGLTDYNQGMASQEYGNWWNRYTGAVDFNNRTRQQGFANKYGQYRDAIGDVFNASGSGLTATNALAGTNSSLATSGGNALLSGAQSAGQATMAGANALASGIGSGINNAMSAAYLGWGGSNPIFGRKSGYGGGGTAP